LLLIIAGAFSANAVTFIAEIAITEIAAAEYLMCFFIRYNILSNLLLYKYNIKNPRYSKY
jgi:hypothetical protein